MIGFCGFNRKSLFIQQINFILPLFFRNRSIITFSIVLNNMQYEHYRQISRFSDILPNKYCAPSTIALRAITKGRIIYAKAGCQRR